MATTTIIRTKHPTLNNIIVENICIEESRADYGPDTTFNQGAPLPSSIYDWLQHLTAVPTAENKSVTFRLSLTFYHKKIAVILQTVNEIDLQAAADNCYTIETVLLKKIFKPPLKEPNILAQLKKEIIAFTNTSIFLSSPLGKAKTVCIYFDDGTKIQLLQ